MSVLFWSLDDKVRGSRLIRTVDRQPIVVRQAQIAMPSEKRTVCLLLMRSDHTGPFAMIAHDGEEVMDSRRASGRILHRLLLDSKGVVRCYDSRTKQAQKDASDPIANSVAAQYVVFHLPPLVVLSTWTQHRRTFVLGGANVNCDTASIDDLCGPTQGIVWNGGLGVPHRRHGTLLPRRTAWGLDPGVSPCTGLTESRLFSGLYAP